MTNRDREASTEQNLAKNSPSLILEVKWAYRWDVFRRLKALGIDCQCSTNKPLLVHLESPTTAIQVWSVVRQFSTLRHELVDWLDNCWHVEYNHQK